jgi:hypothetical protein
VYEQRQRLDLLCQDYLLLLLLFHPQLMLLLPQH